MSPPETELAFAKEREIPLAFRRWIPLTVTTPVFPNDTLARLWSLSNGADEQFSNAHYIVHRRKFTDGDDRVAMIYLSIRTVENDARHDWREFQRIKNELAGPDWWGVEVYPDEADLHDTANQFHLWCFPERPKVYLCGLNVTGDFGFSGREVMTPEQIANDEETGGKARQRPFRDDLVWKDTA